MPLIASPRSWMSWDMDFHETGGAGTRIRARLRTGWFRRVAKLEIDGREHEVGRAGFGWRVPWFLRRDGEPLATARGLGFFTRGYRIECAEGTFELRPISIFHSSFSLNRGGVRVGTLEAQSILSRKLVVDLPEELSIELRLFAAYLVLVSWRRNMDDSPGD